MAEPSPVKTGTELSANGGNLAAVLGGLRQRAPAEFAALVAEVVRLLPEYLGLEVEAGDRGDYFDVTPLIILGATGFVMLRFFAIGTDSKLLYVIAGMCGALLIGLTHMLRSLPRESKRVS